MGLSVVGGLLAHSLALLSDAGHMLADAGSLLLALWAQRLAVRPRTIMRTYGSRRAETLAAFVNAILLAVTSLWIMGESVARWRSAPEVRGGVMLTFGVVGLVANLAAALALSGRSGEANANTRAALAHVLSDAAGSGAAILAALCVVTFGWNRADPLISFLLALLILWSAWRLITEALDVLMEGSPVGLELSELERTIRETPGVSDLHDLHAWTISDGFDVVTVHVVLDGRRHGTDVAREVSERVQTQHRIAHVTVQPEPPSWSSAPQRVPLERRRRPQP
jgi:cobalt-zinc-cadmium efflux system protein